MRESQRQCVAALQPVLDALQTTPQWCTMDGAPDEALGHKSGDVYLRATFEPGGHSCDLYVYADEAGADVDGQWFIYERPDYQNDDVQLIGAYTRFIEHCLVGTPAREACKAARGAH